VSLLPGKFCQTNTRQITVIAAQVAIAASTLQNIKASIPELMA